MAGGRDYRSFVTGHREDEVERLTKRFLAGVKSDKFRPADYDRLGIMVLEKKVAASQSMLKYQKLKQVSKQNKNCGMLHRHRAAWLEGARQMSSERQKAERDVTNFMRSVGADNSETRTTFQPLQKGLNILVEELKEFRSTNVSPLWQLRDEARTWMDNQAKLDAQGVEELRPDKLNTLKEEDEDEELTEEEKFRSMFVSTSKRQEEIMKILQKEEESLSQGLKLCNEELEEVFTEQELLDNSVNLGPPPEVLEWACPSEELRTDAYEEFRYLDEIFIAKLNQHDSLHCDVRWSEASDWSDSDHTSFVVILSQYPPGVHENNWTLCMDMLAKTFPKKTKQQLINHHSWCRRIKQYKEMKESIYNDWKRHKKELLDQVKFAFDETLHLEEVEKVAQEGREQQEKKCRALLDQVQEWRERKMEAWILEQDLIQEMRKQREEEAKKEEEKRQKQVNENKQKVKVFQSEKSKKRKMWIKDTQKRLAELENLLELQAIENEKRVIFREEKRKEKEEEMRQKEEAKEMEREKLEETLEALRAGVRVEAEADPLRLLQDTAATRERYGRNLDTKFKEDDYETASSALHHHISGRRLGYTDDQILADHRVRAEMHLRDAGVSFGEYTRYILQRLKPATEPRRDIVTSHVFPAESSAG